MSNAHREALELLGSVIDRPDVWSALVAALNNRGLRENLVAARREAGVTTEQVASHIGVDEAVVYNFEHEPFPDPTVAFVGQYCRAVGARLDAGVRFFPDEVEAQP